MLACFRFVASFARVEVGILAVEEDEMLCAGRCGIFSGVDDGGVVDVMRIDVRGVGFQAHGFVNEMVAVFGVAQSLLSQRFVAEKDEGFAVCENARASRTARFCRRGVKNVTCHGPMLQLSPVAHRAEEDFFVDDVWRRCAQKHIAAAAQDLEHTRFSVDSEGSVRPRSKL